MIKIASAKGFTTQEIQKLQQAVDLANRVMPTDEFKKAVQQYVQTDGVTAGFTYTDETRAGVYSRITQNWVVDFQIVTPPWYRRWFSSEIAHECQDGTVILDRNKFVEETTAQVAGTAVHETAHRAAFSHPYRRGYVWENSVPEAIGNIVERIGNSLISADTRSPALAVGVASEARV